MKNQLLTKSQDKKILQSSCVHNILFSKQESKEWSNIKDPEQNKQAIEKCFFLAWHISKTLYTTWNWQQSITYVLNRTFKDWWWEFKNCIQVFMFWGVYGVIMKCHKNNHSLSGLTEVYTSHHTCNYCLDYRWDCYKQYDCR